LIDPGQMLGLHQDGTQARNRCRFLSLRPGARRKEAGGEMGKRQVKILSGSFVEDALCHRGGGLNI
jgi:hypothetical protein